MDLMGFVLNTMSSIHHVCFLFFYEPSLIDFSKIIGYMAATAQAAYGEKDETAIREMDVYYTLCAQVLNIKRDIWSSEREIRAVVPCNGKGCYIECSKVGISALNIYIYLQNTRRVMSRACVTLRERLTLDVAPLMPRRPHIN